MPIPTGTETDTFLMDWRECQPIGGGGTSSLTEVMQACAYVGYNTLVHEFQTTSRTTFNAFAVTTLYTATTITTTSYQIPTISGARSGGPDYGDDEGDNLPSPIIGLIVALVVVAAIILGVIFCVVMPRERKRGKQRKRLRVLWREKESLYGDTALLGAIGTTKELSSTPTPTASPLHQPPPPFSPASPPPEETIAIQDRMREMEAEMKNLKDQLRLSQAPHSNGHGPDPGV